MHKNAQEKEELFQLYRKSTAFLPYTQGFTKGFTTRLLC